MFRRVLTGAMAIVGSGLFLVGLAIKAEAFSFSEDFEFESNRDKAGNFIGFQKNTLAGNGWLIANLSDPASDVNPFFTSLTFLEPELKLDRSTPDGLTWEEVYQESFAPNTGRTWLAADYNSVAAPSQALPQGEYEPGTIDAWLISPLLPLQNGAEVSFYTNGWTPSQLFRGQDYVPAADNLELRFSTAEVGEFAFRNTLLQINPNQIVTDQGGYPTEWTQYKAIINGLAQPTEGRFLFRYFVTDAGPGRPNGTLIGLDTFSYDSNPAPIPTPAMLPGLIGIGIGAIRKRRRQQAQLAANAES